MDTTSGLLTHIARWLGQLNPPALLLVALVLAVATFIVATIAASALTGVAEPIISAPFRWMG